MLCVLHSKLMSTALSLSKASRLRENVSRLSTSTRLSNLNLLVSLRLLPRARAKMLIQTKRTRTSILMLEKLSSR